MVLGSKGMGYFTYLHMGYTDDILGQSLGSVAYNNEYIP